MKTINKVRILLILFIVMLVLSGITAFPLRTETAFLNLHKDIFPAFMSSWIEQVYQAIAQTPDLILYGTDWLAFAHLVIALFFIPVYINPVKYKVNLVIAMAACGAVLILAFVCGPLRGIPIFHRLIDCSFGLIGFIPLFVAYKKISQLEINSSNHSS
jgi:hypothetical protein